MAIIPTFKEFIGESKVSESISIEKLLKTMDKKVGAIIKEIDKKHSEIIKKFNFNNRSMLVEIEFSKTALQKNDPQELLSMIKRAVPKLVDPYKDGIKINPASVQLSDSEDSIIIPIPNIEKGILLDRIYSYMGSNTDDSEIIESLKELLLDLDDISGALTAIKNFADKIK